MKTKKKKGVWWKYSLLLLVLAGSNPVIHFINQARRGHPLDVNYFWSELSPLALFGQGLYNGNGGKDWKIGQSKLNLFTANAACSREQLRAFALELVNRDAYGGRSHRFVAVGGNKLVVVGENISRNGNETTTLTYGIAEKLQRGWMYSNGHRENLLTKEYKKFGYGIATSVDGKLYAVQMFAD
jgi:Cysteine-rich secretory protein family